MKKSWKTTLIAVAIAVLVAVEPIIETGTYTIQSIVMAALIAAFGTFTKDKNITGGTDASTLEATKRI